MGDSPRPALGRLRALPVLLFLAALLAVLVDAAVGLQVALTLAPAALLVFPLILGLFPGERVIARLRARRAPVRRRVPARSLGIARRSRDRVTRGGRLVACGMAGRGPPLLSLR